MLAYAAFQNLKSPVPSSGGMGTLIDAAEASCVRELLGEEPETGPSTVTPALRSR